MISFRHESLTLTEVACARGQLLPTDRRLMLYRIRGERSDKIEHRGITHQTSIQLEPVSPELFVLFQHELAREGERQGMLQRFDSSARVPTGAISYINTETRNRTVLIQAFHVPGRVRRLSKPIGVPAAVEAIFLSRHTGSRTRQVRSPRNSSLASGGRQCHQFPTRCRTIGVSWREREHFCSLPVSSPDRLPD